MTDWYILLAVSLFVGVFVLWIKYSYEPKQRKMEQHGKRLFECAAARILINGSSTASQKMILSQIIERRPGMQKWPEWQEVWDGNPPVH